MKRLIQDCKIAALGVGIMVILATAVDIGSGNFVNREVEIYNVRCQQMQVAQFDFFGGLWDWMFPPPLPWYWGADAGIRS
jgi:hypothetical protein